MSANIICSICFEDYRSADDVVSSTCGHIFHNHCLQTWTTRCSPTCPQCRKHCNGTRKIFPQFAETPDKSTKNSQLKGELEKFIKSSKDVRKKLFETEGIYADLLERFETLELQQDEHLKKNQNLLKNIENMKQQTAKENSKLSLTQNELGRIKLNENHLRSLVETLEDKLNTLGMQLNIQINLPHQQQNDELSEKVINLIKNVSYMVRVKKNAENHRQRQNEMERQREYYDCDEQNSNYDQQYDDTSQQNYNQQNNYNQNQRQGHYRQQDYHNNPNGGNRGYVKKKQYRRR